MNPREKFKGGDSLKKTQLKKENLSDQVMQQLRQLITEQNLVPGDRLPSEQELADHFNVGRHTVREALKKMEVMGMVRSKVGQGSFISEIRVEKVVELMMDQLIIGPSDNKKLLELRYVIEAGSAYLSAIHRTENDLHELKQSLIGMEKAKNDPAKLAEMDYQFHMAVVKAAYNEFLNSLLKTVLVLLSTKVKKPLEVDRSVSQMLPIHSEIYQAIADANPAAAEEKMQQHMKLLLKAFQFQDISPFQLTDKQEMFEANRGFNANGGDMVGTGHGGSTSRDGKDQQIFPRGQGAG